MKVKNLKTIWSILMIPAMVVGLGGGLFVPQAQAATLSITAPAEGAALSGLANLTATIVGGHDGDAADFFFSDYGAFSATCDWITGSCSLSIDTTMMAEGPQTLALFFYDNSGLSGGDSDTTATPVNITINNAASVAVSSITPIADISVANGTALGSVGLPATADVVLSDASTAALPVVWDGGTPAYDSATANTYAFVGTLTLPGGITNPSNLTASVNVIVAAPVGTSVTTIDATGITTSEATLNGSVGATAANDASFWASLAPFDTSSATLPAGVFSTPVLGPVGANASFFAPLSTTGISVTPNTPYYFAAWADLGGVWTPGAVLSFNTAAVVSPAPVDLLSILTNNLVVLSETGITDTGSHTSAITGNIGSSPIAASAMNGVFCSEITGTIYGVDATYTGSGDTTCFAGSASDKTLVDNAVLDMGTAYTDAAGRAPDFTELGTAGNIGGLTFTPGVYKWSTDVNIPSDITLSGSASDVWIFQIAGDLDVSAAGDLASGIKINLIGGAEPANVFWQVGGPTGATLGTYATFNGNILSAKQIVIQTGAVLTGRALAQTQVTLDANTVVSPAPITAVTGVTLDQPTLALVAGGSVGILTATIQPADASNQTVTWVSDNGTVASVDAAGVVTPLSDGTANITVTTVEGGFTAISTVTVSAAVATDVIDLTSPLDLSTVSGLVSIVASTTNSNPINYVEFIVVDGFGNIVLNASNTLPDISGGNIYTTSWDTTAVADGDYQMHAIMWDGATNPATPWIVVTVNNTSIIPDTTAPVITLLGTSPIDVVQGSAYTDAGATALDNIDGNITSNITVVNPVNTAVLGTYTVTYNVSDAALNAATQVTRTVNVVAPAPLPGTLSAADFGSVNYDSGLGILKGYTAGFTLADATFAGVQSIIEQLFSGTTLLQTNTATAKVGTDITGTAISSPFDIFGTFDYLTDGYWTNVRQAEYGQTLAPTKVVATVTLQNGKVVTAENILPDTTVDIYSPVITILGNNPLNVLFQSTYVDAGATALDNVNGDLTAGIATTSNVNTNATGTYSVIYTVTDTAGNTATATRVVNVVTDIVPPVITILGSNPAQVTINTAYTDAGATALDNVSGVVPVTATGTVNTAVLGAYTITYSATDTADNLATSTRTVNVVAAPVVRRGGSSGGYRPAVKPVVTVVTTTTSGQVLGASTFRFLNRFIRQGQRNSDVTALQQFLIRRNSGSAARNLARVGATGYFGGLTRASLLEYQRINHLRPGTGVVYPNLAAFIAAMISAGL